MLLEAVWLCRASPRGVHLRLTLKLSEHWAEDFGALCPCTKHTVPTAPSTGHLTLQEGDQHPTGPRWPWANTWKENIFINNWTKSIIHQLTSWEDSITQDAASPDISFCLKCFQISAFHKSTTTLLNIKGIRSDYIQFWNRSWIYSDIFFFFL